LRGALPDQEMCEHCTSYDGGYPCHMCGALSPRDRQNPEALRRAADVMERLRMDAAEHMDFQAGGPAMTTEQLRDVMRKSMEQIVTDASAEDDPWIQALRKP
jgi:hypothetical protein